MDTLVQLSHDHLNGLTTRLEYRNSLVLAILALPETSYFDLSSVLAESNFLLGREGDHEPAAHSEGA